MHLNEKTTSQLRQEEFTGFRIDQIMMEWQYWEFGSITVRATFAELERNPFIFDKRMDAFYGR